MNAAHLSNAAAPSVTHVALTDHANGVGGSRPRMLRRCARAAWLAGELALVFLRYPQMTAGKDGEALTLARARWVRWSSQRLLRVFGAQVSVRGDAPRSGLLVCNHLSYLDILVLASLVPAVFVSKADVARWPVLGRLARLAGTVFVRRERRADVARVNREMQAALNAGLLVVVFPEGTSSGGDTVLPFQSSLFDAAIQSGVPATAGCIRYRMPEGNPAEEVCYWRDMTLFSHLVNLLGRPAVDAFVAFAPVDASDCSRKELARRAHTATLALHGELANQTERLSQ